MTLGYSDSEPGYEVELSAVSLGNTHQLAQSSGDYTSLEQAMSSAAAKVQNVICHELSITDDNEFLMVFMARK